MTQTDLAKKLSRSQRWVSWIERGDISPDLDGLDDLGAALGVHRNELIGEPPPFPGIELLDERQVQEVADMVRLLAKMNALRGTDDAATEGGQRGPAERKRGAHGR